MAEQPLSDAKQRRQARQRAIIESYNAGDPVAVIARRLGIGERQVTQVARAAGIARSAGRPVAWLGKTQRLREEIAIGYRTGEGVVALSERLGIGARTVTKIASEIGVARKVGRPRLWSEEAQEQRRLFRMLRSNGVPAPEARKAITFAASAL